MTTPLEAGRLLEQRVAEFFRSHGYQARCNEVVEGRSGGTHEVDVLAETADALTTFRVAVECKAWRQPIEKDVVSKLHYVVGDLGLSKGILVSLAGCTVGAERAAADLGIELWGPDEVRRHLGPEALAGLAAPASRPVAGWGYRLAVDPGRAERLVRAERAGQGVLGRRAREALRWSGVVWLPAYTLRLAVAQPHLGRSRSTLRSVTIDNLYDAVAGDFLGRPSAPWEEVDVDPRGALRPALREARLHGALRRAVDDYRRVATAAARERHAANLERLGLPVPCVSVTVEHTAAVHLPYVVGVLEGGDASRAVAVDGTTGELADAVSRLLTAHLGLLRPLLPA